MTDACVVTRKSQCNGGYLFFYIYLLIQYLFQSLNSEGWKSIDNGRKSACPPGCCVFHHSQSELEPINARLKQESAPNHNDDKSRMFAGVSEFLSNVKGLCVIYLYAWKHNTMKTGG